eukprot:scaffold10626_cov112-Cylindrotheca_fusiformis.AAC.14
MEGENSLVLVRIHMETGAFLVPRHRGRAKYLLCPRPIALHRTTVVTILLTGLDSIFDRCTLVSECA